MLSCLTGIQDTHFHLFGQDLKVELSFLTEPAEAARSRIRYKPLLAPLARLGVNARLLEGRPRELFRGPAAQRIEGSEVVVVPARLYSERHLARLRALSRCLLLDLDDAIHRRPRDQSHRGPSKTRRRRFEQAMAAVDGVVCAGPRLLEELRERYPRQDFRLIPNSLEPWPWAAVRDRMERRRANGELRLLWLGSKATLLYLEMLLDYFARAPVRAGTTLRVVADAFPAAPPGLRIESVRWSLAAEEEALRVSDIGLMPLDPHPWSLAKSGFKLLRYMGAGLPVLSCSGGNGAYLAPRGYPYLIDELASWPAVVEELGADPGLRESLGCRLYLEVHRRFRPPLVARAWAAALAHFLGSGHSS